MAVRSPTVTMKECSINISLNKEEATINVRSVGTYQNRYIFKSQQLVEIPKGNYTESVFKCNEIIVIKTEDEFWCIVANLHRL